MNLKPLLLSLLGGALTATSALGTQTAKVSFDTAKKHPAPARIAAAPPVVPAKTAYAWSTRDRSGAVPNGIVSFSLDNPGSLTSVHPLANLAYAGCFGDGKYYFDRYRTYTENGQSTWAHIALSTVDINTGAVADLTDWSDEYFVINDMAYDYTTGRIMAMCRTFYIDDFLADLSFEYSALMAINPTTGVMTEVKQFIDWEHGALTNPTYYTLACDMNGTLYSVDQNSNLVRFDADNDYAAEVIGRTGVNPSHTTQSMEFDHTTGTLYWCADFSSEVAQLLVVDTNSGLARAVGETGTDSHLVGLYIPFAIPSGAAPAAVSELKATPDASGATAVTLSWKNPSKSYGGANLPSITSVKITRNGADAATVSGTPGQEMTWSDAPAEPGLYTYTVTATNSAGDGMASGVNCWAGKDLPMAVTDLGIGRTDEGYALLQWVEPTEGIHAGVLDVASLGYKIVRFPDGATVAEDARGTSFTDNTVPGTGRYYYTVESHTAQGTGEMAKSVEIALGSAIEEFPWNTLFADQSEFDLWTVVNCNGGSTWKWKARTVASAGYDHQAMYEYDNQNDGDDYLVSPDLYLKKGARYQLKFAYAGANEYHTEKMEVTFGHGKTAEAQNDVLKSLTMTDGTFRFCTLDLPEVEETGYYNFAFHAISEKGNFNLYVTDVTVTQTQAAPDDPDTDILASPRDLRADVDNHHGIVTLTWNESSESKDITENISEDFEDITRWEINPAGKYGWSYVDRDGGIPYVADWIDIPNDRVPLAAMILAPYELPSDIYSPNPPHSGNQYLLFKSNFSAGDGSRPAPAPDDWFISPKLNFGKEFIFSFWCKADPDVEDTTGDPWNKESFHVGYSLTGNAPEDFIFLTDEPETVRTAADEWTRKEYSIPAEAKYVCIHYCTPSQGYWFMVDDLFIGTNDAPAAAPRKAVELQHFDVYVDDKKVASTVETTHKLMGLTNGSHIAKVVAVYDKGESAATAVAFTTAVSGVESVDAQVISVYPNPAADVVNFGTAVEHATLYNLAGTAVAENRGAASMPVSHLTPGLYLLRLENAGAVTTVRLIIK